jgi:hypothetical protein
MHQPGLLHRVLWLGLMLLGCSAVFAQAPPALFIRDGKISTVNLTEGMMTVNDLRYYVSPTVHVYTYDGSIKDPRALRAETRLQDGRALREGMRIGYTVAGEGGGKRGEITEAWILPPGRRPELDRSGKSAGPPAAKATGKAQRAQPGK